MIEFCGADAISVSSGNMVWAKANGVIAVTLARRRAKLRAPSPAALIPCAAPASVSFFHRAAALSAGTINLDKGLQYFPNWLCQGTVVNRKPVDPDLAITSIARTEDGVVELVFASEAGTSYAIEASDDLESDFVSVLEATGSATSTTVTVPTDDVPRRFYRVRRP